LLVGAILALAIRPEIRLDMRDESTGAAVPVPSSR
jgi:hypothetical protein